jgi:hypothetical protein
MFCWLAALIDPVADTPLVTAARWTVAVLGLEGSSLVHEANSRTASAPHPATPIRRSRPVGTSRPFIRCTLPSRRCGTITTLWKRESSLADTVSLVRVTPIMRE